MPLYSLDGIAPELPADNAYWVAPDANVIGQVRLGRDASVWFGSTLRGDNDWIDIGEETNIQDGTVIHVDPGQPVEIGRGVTVGHKVILHSCQIGDGTLVGMGSIVLNRARIGKNCLIGAGTLITEGKEFPDGSMILGTPGRVARPLRDDEIARLQISASVYVQNYRRFRDGLKPLA